MRGLHIRTGQYRNPKRKRDRSRTIYIKCHWINAILLWILYSRV